MTPYRAVSYDELEEIELFGVFRPGPPSNQGKWPAGSLDDAAEWGKRLHRLGNPPFHLIEVRVAEAELQKLHYNPLLDGIGPAWYADCDQLACLEYIREVSDVSIW